MRKKYCISVCSSFVFCFLELLPNIFFWVGKKIHLIMQVRYIKACKFKKKKNPSSRDEVHLLFRIFV